MTARALSPERIAAIRYNALTEPPLVERLTLELLEALEAAQGLLREFAAEEPWEDYETPYEGSQCFYCKESKFNPRTRLFTHAVDCLWARARAFLGEGEP